LLEKQGVPRVCPFVGAFVSFCRSANDTGQGFCFFCLSKEGPRQGGKTGSQI